MFLVGTLLRFGFVTAWIFHLVACMGLQKRYIGRERDGNSRIGGYVATLSIIFKSISTMSSGCFGCDAKNKLMKSQESQPHQCTGEGDGKNSRHDMDNNAVCISSINTPDSTLDSHVSRNTSQDFINHGFLLWNQIRQQWVGKKRKSQQTDQNREPRLSRSATYDNLLGSNKPFAKPVPLSEMVDFLVDVWEKEGMYD